MVQGPVPVTLRAHHGGALKVVATVLLVVSLIALAPFVAALLILAMAPVVPLFLFGSMGSSLAQQLLSWEMKTMARPFKGFASAHREGRGIVFRIDTGSDLVQVVLAGGAHSIAFGDTLEVIGRRRHGQLHAWWAKEQKTGATFWADDAWILPVAALGALMTLAALLSIAASG